MRNVYAFGCIVLLLFMLQLPTLTAASADTKKGETISLTREKMLELAAKNYMSVQQQNLQLQLDAAQLRYSEEQRKKQGEYSRPIVNKLPTTIEELRKLVPDYDSLTDQEKQETDSVLMIQAMINASMNSMLEAQAEYQYTLGVQQWSMQMNTLDEEIRNSNYNLKLSRLEKEKLELLAQLYAIQSYYEIIELQIDIQSAEFEIQTAGAAAKDTEKLYRYGLATKKEVDQANQSVDLYKRNRDSLELQLLEKMKLFKQILGINNEDTVILPTVEAMKQTNSYEETKIDIMKQIDHIKAEETINYVKSRLEAAKTKTNDQPLEDYLHTVVVVETEKKAIIDQWLEQKVDSLQSEQKNIKQTMKELENEHTLLAAKLGDDKKLLSSGSISVRELEITSNELKRLEFKLEKSRLQYALWQEKKRIAVLGVLP
ncbi:hypothetical protein J40TS1_43120 [Paenibacillus montaniterrae]|uniref:TolC family protein n=1 Tax=Paenibacillus montaniterrae TaxID=429341 RepID=A0A919YSJ9_9BACL|nr:hypothetical protein [Paenibacillus montaniterrae]GIP18670.1 hypothetical protein J40TS1_43120 [Paenibacillus montaniterrae]